jgi:hypothetical protein
VDVQPEAFRGEVLLLEAAEHLLEGLLVHIAVAALVVAQSPEGGMRGRPVRRVRPRTTSRTSPSRR